MMESSLAVGAAEMGLLEKRESLDAIVGDAHVAADLLKLLNQHLLVDEIVLDDEDVEAAWVERRGGLGGDQAGGQLDEA